MKCIYILRITSYYLFVCAFLFLSINVNASPNDTSQPEKNLKVTLDVGLDGRQSFLFARNKTVPIKVGGVNLGIEINGYYRSGLGFYSWDKQQKNIIVHAGKPDEKEVAADISFEYMSLYNEVAWLQRKQWELSTSLQLGIGSVVITYNNEQDQEVEVLNEEPGVAALSLRGYYKFFTWLGVGGGAGYRYMLTSKQPVKDRFNAPFYMTSIKLFLSPIFNAIFNQQKMERTKGCLGCYYGCFSL